MASVVAGLEPWLQQLSFWTADMGVAGMALFALASGLAVVFCFPGSIFMTASGAAFGLTRGFLTAQAGATLGAGLAFLVSRYVARRRVAAWVSSRPAFAAVDEAIGTEGFKIVILTRCCPLFPYIFQNYAYGLSRVSFGHYVLGSFIGLVPATLVFSYLGALGRSGLDAAAGATTSLDLLLRAFGLLATVAASLYLTRLSRRALRKAGL